MSEEDRSEPADKSASSSGESTKHKFPWRVTEPCKGFQSFSHCCTSQNKVYASSEEYFNELRSWLQQAFFWHSVTAAFPYYLIRQQQQQQTQNLTSTTNNVRPQQFPFDQFPQGPQPNPQRTATNNERGAPAGIQCKIPPFWKRIVAEIIDFFILFFLKLAAIYVALDFVDTVYLEKFALIDKENFEYKAFLKMTEGIVIQELIHRVVVCFFEAIWLKGGIGGQIGGATPGKLLLKLRVVRCESVTPLNPLEGEQNRERIVIVRPGTNMGLKLSFLRAAVKNFILAVFIPSSFAFFYFPNNRTGYDMICNTIVVEEPIRVHRAHQD